ncbi:MAG: type IV secretory system conjugative DNA transfer family protein [Aggregatilineales bacterium]
MRNSTLTFYTYTITLPKGTAWDAPRAHQFTEQMLFAFPALAFRIIATQSGIEWQIVDLIERMPGAVESAIRASYPEAQVRVEPFGEGEWTDQPFSRYVIKYQYKVPLFVAPIQYVTDLTGPDPLASLTEAMSNVREGERIVYTVIVAGFADTAYREGQKLIEAPVYTGGFMGLLFPPKVERYVPALQKVMNAKLQQRLYNALVFIQIDSPDPTRLESLLVIDKQMVHFDRSEFNGLCWLDDQRDNPGGIVRVNGSETDLQTSAIGLYALSINAARPDQHLLNLRKAMRLVLEAREVASLWHLPHERCTAPTIGWAHPQVRLPARLMGRTEGVCIGVNPYAGKSEPVYIPDRSGHVSIVGKTGVGKSTLMHQLVHQDIASGRGVAVIDPNGALVRDILRFSIPTAREHDVVVLDLANDAYPPPMNLLAVPPGVDHGSAAGQVMGVLNTLYDEFHEAQTVADTAWATLCTVLADDTPTIRDLVRVLTNSEYRERLVSQVENPAVQEFWERFDGSRGQQEQLVRPIMWRMRGFYGNSALYPVLCHPDRIDIPSLIAHNNILLVSLKTDESRIPSREQRLLGAALMSQLQLAVLGRPAGSTPYYLYIDEVQHFVTTPLETVLSEARKFGLCLTLANQYLRQLTGNTFDALMGNIGTLVTFQCGLDDAKALAPYMLPGFDAEALINLNKYDAAVKLRYNDETQPAFSLHTNLPLVSEPDLPTAIAREQYLRTLSIARYTPKSRADVMHWLKERYPVSGKAADVSASISYYDQ